MMWQCPICDSVLYTPNDSVHCDNTWRCQQAHCFDVAKQGYVNLLPVQFKHSLDPGDDKSMVKAREVFLNNGHYDPLIQAIASDLQGRISQDKTYHLFDAGCGEGYYLRRLNQLLESHDITYYGNDISKNAVLRAAKQAHSMTANHQYIVASSYHLPVSKHSIDVLLQVFAPIPSTEALRILKRGGLWYQIVPNTLHLQEFKSLLYKNIQSHDPHQELDVNLINEFDVNFTLSLSSEEKVHLMAMTPYAHSATEDKRNACINSNSSLTIAFKVYVYQQFLTD